MQIGDRGTISERLAEGRYASNQRPTVKAPCHAGPAVANEFLSSRQSAMLDE